MSWQPIGRIVRLQIQRSSLKLGEKPNRWYDPTPLLAVPSLRLTHDGAIGLLDGQQIVDVHNATHPQTRNSIKNPLSLGFTGHYRLMQQRFGVHLSDGIAGENILVTSEQPISLSAIQTLAFSSSDGHIIRLSQVIVAAPCVEFSRFALQNPDPETAQLKAALQFLNDGMRGFYLRLAPEQAAADIHTGDLLLAQ